MQYWVKYGLMAFLFSAALCAEEKSGAAESNEQEEQYIDVPRPPELPKSVQSGEVLEPQIRVIQEHGRRITEYRVNDQLYMVKISAAGVKPYYLVDRDGNGELESRVNDIHQDVAVPQWVLWRW